MLDLFEATWQELWAGRQEHQGVGSVYTRPEIVELILDLAGYTPDAGRLARLRVLEPGCGDGAFVTHVVSRLLESERRHHGVVSWDDPLLDGALRAADISSAALHTVGRALIAQLHAAGCPGSRAEELVRSWLVHTDFLLHEWPGRYDVVVGNPPYVRIEDLPRALLARYRGLYPTLGDRADLYVGFMERGLQLLSDGGVLAFITANRFAKNHYGRHLRKLIARQFHVRTYLNLEHTQPFESDVSAYPAIVLLDRERDRPTWAGTLASLAPEALAGVRASVGSDEPMPGLLSRFTSWYPDGAAWTSTSASDPQRFRRAGTSLSPLELSAADTRVGIGVATGADRVFILPDRHPGVESDRQIPLVLASDVRSGEINWSGHHLLDPFAGGASAGLVDLAAFPGLGAYLRAHEEPLRRRHVARTRPSAWYRTIDRIHPLLRHRPKLLIPDIQSADSAVVVLDEGAFYPHHNLYWITSGAWDLRALKALLRSSQVLRQVRAHSVQMRGGSLRWQAQTLRKILVPPLRSLADAQIEALVSVSGSRVQDEIDQVVDGIYGMADPLAA